MSCGHDVCGTLSGAFFPTLIQPSIYRLEDICSQMCRIIFTIMYFKKYYQNFKLCLFTDIFINLVVHFSFSEYTLMSNKNISAGSYLSPYMHKHSFVDIQLISFLIYYYLLQKLLFSTVSYCYMPQTIDICILVFQFQLLCIKFKIPRGNLESLQPDKITKKH